MDIGFRRLCIFIFVIEISIYVGYTRLVNCLYAQSILSAEG
ncbi:hypothetical protein Ocin01_11692 [Orchesella cincta]|uniref:Uncharacterized protein n=1 Tax=Orchesella cincta TaxID=48709 RepID=A0A1D2MQ21_ORCCI|nr:hypothetical protein Ocin01_11692 [Orchesella cincta]